MMYRKLDVNGDYVFGKGSDNFYKNTPSTVAQAVKTRLGLIQGEWFLDTTVGTPYSSQILGAGKIATYDAAIRSAILNTPGVTGIVSYSSGVDPTSRTATIVCTINTVYGSTSFTSNL